jgi:hypothetical protein
MLTHFTDTIDITPALIDPDLLWTVEQKADRLLCRLPAETISYLGDGFPWEVDDDDVRIARVALDGVRLGAILLGRELARITENRSVAVAA